MASPSDLQVIERVFDLFSGEKDEVKGRITMSNRLACATHQLDLYELRLVYLALTKVNAFPRRDSVLTLHKNEGWRVVLNALEYAEVFSLTRKAAYAQLRMVVDGLMGKEVKRVLNRNALGEERYEKFVWVQYAQYDESKHSIEIIFSVPITPHPLGLKDHFTLFLLRHVSGLDSSCAVALYRNLKSWIDVGRWAPSIEEFWETMAVLKKATIGRISKHYAPASWSQLSLRSMQRRTCIWNGGPLKPACAKYRALIFGL